MKKLLFSLALILGISSMFAQPGVVGWESHWSGYTTDSRGISRMSMFNGDVAWTVAYDGSANHTDISAVGVTTDGGVTWTTYDPVTLPGAVNPGISMVFPYNATTAFIAAYKRSFGNGGVWKTTDNGANWVKVSSSTMYANSASFCNLVWFTDNNNGFIQGDPINGEFEMYSTNDGGATWTPIDGANIADPLPGEYGYTGGIVSAGGTLWMTTSNGRLLRSTDAGVNWTAHPTPLADFGGNNGDSGSVTFKDANEGWILRDNSELYHTTDAGDTWTLLSSTVLTDMSGDIVVVPGSNPTRLIIADADYNHTNYGSAYSDDGGVTWTKILYYKLDGFNNSDWIKLTNYLVGTAPDQSPWQLQHTCVTAYDQDHILSGTFMSQLDPNDSNTYNGGVFVYNNTTVDKVTATNVKGLQIYPNPVENFVHISASNDIKNVSIYDMSGKMVKNVNNIDITETTIYVQDLRKGFYLMKVSDVNGGEQTTKLVIK